MNVTNGNISSAVLLLLQEEEQMMSQISLFNDAYQPSQVVSNRAIVSFPWSFMLAGVIFILLYCIDRLAISHFANEEHSQASHYANSTDHHGHSHGHGHGHGRGSSEPSSPSSAKRQASNHHSHITDALESISDLLEQQEAASSAPVSTSEATSEPTAAVHPHPHSAGALGEEEQSNGSQISYVKPKEGIWGSLRLFWLSDGSYGSVEEQDGLKDTSKVHRREEIMQAFIFTCVMSLHGFFDGLSLGVDSTSNSFYAIVIAVVFHKIFDGLAVGAAVYPAKFKIYVAWGLCFLAALSTPVGIAVGLGASAFVAGTSTIDLVTGIILGLSGGSFLFISITELLPASLNDGRWWSTKLGAFSFGFLVMTVLAAYV
jgi:zinc transporter ZupT